MSEVKIWLIDFADKRRLQRSMMAETKKEVEDYIFNKYGAGFVVTEKVSE